jgi:hypothetical protein
LFLRRERDTKGAVDVTLRAFTAGDDRSSRSMHVFTCTSSCV